MNVGPIDLPDGAGKELYEQPPEISFHALTGDSVQQIIRMMGRLKGRRVKILVDNGPTQNFLCE